MAQSSLLHFKDQRIEGELEPAQILTEEVKKFADCIRNHKGPETGGPEAMQALALIVAAIRSARTGELVSLAKGLAG